MRIILPFLLIFLPVFAAAQTVNFEDGFDDQDISDWSGTTENFTFINESGNILLQQDAEGAGVSYLSIESTDVVGYWEFFVRMGFAPSDGNKTDIYLMSDAADLTGSLNGYMLQAGENLNNDVFRLFRITNGAKDGEVLAGTTNISTGGDYRVKVTRDGSGNWSLEVAEGYAGILSEDASGTDNTYTSATHFGFKTTYSSTRSDLFTFDFKIDIPPVEVSSISVVNDTEIDVAFSQDIDFGTVQTSDFTLNPGNINPQSVAQQSTDTARITFSSAISSGQNELSVSNIDNASGESSLADTTVTFFIYDEYQPGDILINEFMYNQPSGATEYVELINISGNYLNLKNWQLGDNGAFNTISTSDLTILPDSFIVLTDDATTLTSFFGEGNYVQLGSWRALNNTGSEQVRIRDENGITRDSLEYTSSWGGNGVALERRDPTVSAIFQANWGESPAVNFGTPGFSNLVEPDNIPPELTSLELTGNDQIQLIFSERLQQDPAENVSNFSLSADNVSGLPGLQSASFSVPDTIILQYDGAFPSQPEGTIYELSISGQTDIFNNTAGEIIESFLVINYETADSGDVFITEFMFDPAPGFTDFIELYNPTENAFDLQGWTYNDNSGNRRVISDNEFAFKPGERIVLAPDSSIFDLFPDITLIAMGSRFANLNSTTPDDIVIRNGNGVLIDSLTYAPSWGGDDVSLERRSIQHSATFQENWGDSPSENLATPGSENLIEQDTSPPELTSISLKSASQVQLIFSERIQRPAAENTANFELNADNISGSLPGLQSAVFSTPDTILLQYDSELPSQPEGTTYEITINNQADIFDNSAGQITDSFFVIEYTIADSGDVFVTEFMYDPAAGFTDFIELYNPTQNSYNLQGWTYNDNSGNRRSITDSEFPIGPDSRVVLAPDSSVFILFPDITLIAMGSRFANLNSTTPDDIVIRNQNGVLIDSLTYNSGWGGDEVSLERRSIDHSAIYQENWGDSPSENFATPGKPNEIDPDNEPPEITEAFITAADSIYLSFNERVDSVAATDLSNFSVTSAASLSEITGYDGRSLTLVLNSPLSDGENFTLSIRNQQDIFGNVLESAEVNLEYTLISAEQPGDVIVNEILYRRANANSEEFIELFNRTDRNFDLGNWTFSDATGRTTIPQGTQIRSGEYLVLTDSESFGTAPDDVSTGPAKISSGSAQTEIENVVYIPGFPSLNDDEDAIVIKNQQGNVIDSLYYQSTWGGDEPGVSLERKDPESPSNDASNWATSTAEGGHSAGRQSSVFQPDETPPEIIFSKLQNDGKIFVAFSEFVQVDNTDILVNNEPTTVSEYHPENGNIVIIGESGFPSGEPLSIIFTNVTDFRGNANANLTVEVSQPITSGSVVINEILYDPLANSDDNLPDQTEYLELYNRSEYAISLEGFFLHDEPDENNDVRSIFPVSSQFKWIPSGGYALIYAENQADNFGDSQLARYFEMQDEDDRFFIRADRASLSLANSNDAIYLADSTGAAIDSVFYDQSWQNPNLFDTKGVALERIDPYGPSNDESNWSSSTRVSGGTPGEQNSIFQQAGAGPDGTGITFTPNPFSPDDDGFEDALFINYKLEEPDYLLRVRIFDRYGRQVRKLADGLQAGFEGSLIWDGLTDNRQRNRVGIYIVLFEAYNSANGKNRTFKETVVLARKF